MSEDILKRIWLIEKAQKTSALGAISSFQQAAYGLGYSREAVNGFLKKHLTLR